jgi:hypothetical protein
MHNVHQTIEGESLSVEHERCEPDFMTELRAACAIAGQWRDPTRQPLGLIPIL